MNESKLRDIQLYPNENGMSLLVISSRIEEPIAYIEESATCDSITGIPISGAEDLLQNLEGLTDRGFLFYDPISFFGFSKSQRKEILKEVRKIYRKGNYKNLPSIWFS